MKHEGDLRSLRFSPDSAYIVSITSGDDGKQALHVWKSASGELSAELAVDEIVGTDLKCYGFSPNGQQIVVGTARLTVEILRTATLERIGPKLQHPRTLRKSQGSYLGDILFHLADTLIHPNGRLIVTVSKAGYARLWDSTTGRPIQGNIDLEREIVSAALSPDGEYLVTTGADGTAQVWSIPDAAPVGGPMLHSGRVTDANFSPDGQKIVTASADGIARIWETASGQLAPSPILPIGRPSTIAREVQPGWRTVGHL